MLALLARNGCNIGFIERPLVLGIGWWLTTGEAMPALPLAVFFELFWLDLFPLGTFIPPMAGFPYLLILAMAQTMGWSEPSVLAFPLACILPLAYAVPCLEHTQRNLQRDASEQMTSLLYNPEQLKKFVQRTLLRSVLQQIAAGSGLFLVSFACIWGVFSLMPSWGFHQSHPITLDVDWSILYGIAAVGALLSLRIRRAYYVLAIGMSALLVSVIL